MKRPAAKKIPHSMSLHGDTRIDNYYWLRDDQREDSEVLDYLRAENDYGRQVMASQQTLQNRVLKEMVDRIPQEDSTVPYVRNGYRYYSRYEPGNEYASYYRQPASADPDKDEWQLLLDANKRAAHSEFYTMGALAVSPDNRVMALAEDFLSRRQYGIRFRNLETGSWYPEVLSCASPSFAWANDSRTVYYVLKHAKTLLPYQVWRHELGTRQDDDELVYEEEDDTFYLSVHKTTSEHFVLIALYSTTTSEIRLIDAEYPDAQPQVFCPRRKGHEYSIDHYDHHFYIRSNRDGKNFGIYRSAWLAEKRWEALVPPREHVVIEDFQLFRDWLVIEERQRGLTSLRQICWKTGETFGIAFDDPTYVTWLAYNPTPESNKLRYGYSSMTMPTTIFELDMDSGERRVLKRTPVYGFNAENYKSEHLWIKVSDGTEVPVSLVYHRHHYQPGKNPMLVYGYGAYGSTMDADFSASRLSLLDRGFIYALVHVRGGGELGQQWYDAGRLMNKMNSFTDFIDVTNALVAQGYGDPAQLYAMGGSAGGLLMGAVINMAPERFKGVIAQVPFVDVVTTMLDESIPLTTGEYDEWGNPNDEAFYHYIKQYSPYDNVAAKAYPHMLVTTGLHDSQVQYWEPAKWVAKLRELKTDDNLLLLCTDMDSGHGGKSGRFKSYEGVALEYTFLIALTQESLPGSNY
ncbi:prolyl oligopeptidase family serine peptidase [[Erwinia] mediterraneensis]|uniref:prolyl oligopeptidase family serine peptidase n=1 Tax=[Erwinia] mediterraneensis TaxID=2161819 RepID=UPI0010301777|nr:prolyl oligopeptidase family serine peptidase [[Erwinia] mediterraneensis]